MLKFGVNKKRLGKYVNNNIVENKTETNKTKQKRTNPNNTTKNPAKSITVSASNTSSKCNMLTHCTFSKTIKTVYLCSKSRLTNDIYWEI